MDAEIRRLTYVQRYGGSKPWSGIPNAAQLMRELPGAFGRDEAATRHTAKMPDVRLESRIIELENERSDREKRYQKELAHAHRTAAENLAEALREQKAALERTFATEVTAAMASFREEQKQYFREAESAVVRLALGIAARVLHRESQLDPLLLRGAVRVALEDAQQGTGCVLEVNQSDVNKWQQWLSSETESSFVEVRGREDVDPGHCRVLIGSSAADLSVHAQLAEIERGFFDLLEGRQFGVTSEREQNR